MTHDWHNIEPIDGKHARQCSRCKLCETTISAIEDACFGGEIAAQTHPTHGENAYEIGTHARRGSADCGSRQGGVAIDLDAIRARLAAATPRPWRLSRRRKADVVRDVSFPAGGHVETIALAIDLKSRDLIAHAPTDIAELCEEVEWLRAEVAAMKLQGVYAWPRVDSGSLRMCPRSERPCGLGCDADQCVLGLCRHLRTAQTVVGDIVTRVQTVCLDCGAVIL